MAHTIEPFEWKVSDAEVADLHRRLDQTRWPDQLDAPANQQWEYGTELSYLRRLVAYWRYDFDVQKNVQVFNKMPQFTASIHGRRLHFVHAQSLNPSATPLLLAHGWPGSVWEFHKVVEPLRRNFHIVAPSIPGYSFSEPPHHRGHTVVETARTFHALMTKLKYTNYFVQGGDWGSVIVRSMAQLYPRNVLALHTNMGIGWRPANFDPSTLSNDDVERLKKTKGFSTFGSGYGIIQAHRPQTLAYGLNDSPVGLLAWILEKYRAWTDNRGDPVDALTKDEMLTNVMLYWQTRTIGSSVRYYFENGYQGHQMLGISSEPAALKRVKVEVPSAVLRLPQEIFHYPRVFLEQAYNLVRLTDGDKGGHFAAWEQPELLVDDLRQFFLHDYPKIALKQSHL